MEIIKHKDYRSFLKEVLEQRISDNENYSLRAFARDLKISPQALSLVIGKKKAISPEMAARLADRLGLNPSESSVFLDLVTIVHTKSAAVRKIAEHRVQASTARAAQFEPLDVEIFKVISDWYHYAIMELSETADFVADAKWIADRLGIAVVQAEQAIERLLKLELLEEGTLKKTKLDYSTSVNVPSSAIRKFNKQILSKAIDSIETQSVEERDISTMTMAIDPELLPKAQELLQEYRRRLSLLLESGRRTEVYTMSVSLFRLSKKGSLR